MQTATPCDALRARKRLELRYDGFTRVVEVHAVGYSSKGGGLMRVWQVRGGSASGERSGWKLLKVEEALGSSIVDEASEAPRQGYAKNDKAMERIVCQL